MDNPSKIPCDNLNTFCDFSANNPSSYASFAIRRRRNQRRLRHETINMYILNRSKSQNLYGKPTHFRS
ncbi:unnamed protein product [Rhizophagus irregularis]|nr:unnamed protein product [Rhizophagus irregularis]